MEYIVTIEKFKGPLDLLLHLIKESNININDISIEVIAKQYLDYIETMEKLDLTIASEYLVMAADLIEMKSRTLLPPTEDEEEEDPREMLINKLLLYKNYKEITENFRELKNSRDEYYDKEFSLEIDGIENLSKIPDDLNIDSLTEAFKEMLKRLDKEKPINTRVVFKEYSVSKRCIEIKDVLKKKTQVAFNELFDILTKDYIVVTFLAILNLASAHELYINQDNNFGNIIISNKEVKM